MKFNIKEWQEKHIINEVNVTSEVKKLYSILNQAIKQATKVGKLATPDNADSFDGQEGQEVGMMLEQIYAAMSTGNPKDKSYNDEIFK